MIMTVMVVVGARSVAMAIAAVTVVNVFGVIGDVIVSKHQREDVTRWPQTR